MINTKKTFDQLIYEHTAEEIILGLTENIQEVQKDTKLYALTRGMDFSVIKGMIIEPVNNMIRKYHIQRSNDIKELPFDFREMIDVVKLGEYDMSMNQVIETTKSIYKDHNEKVYGVLVSRKGGVSGKETFNPFHPLNAKYIAEGHLIEDMDKPDFTMMIYVFNNDPRNFFLKEEYEYYYTGKEEDYIQEIINILAATDPEDNMLIINKNFKADIVNDTFVLKYDQVITDKNTGKVIEQEHSTHLYIPLQIVNKNGLAYPFYGTVYSTKGVAFDISPMQSANISGDRHRELGGGSRVCTKLGDSKTIKGISALNHSNLTSPLKREILDKGAFLYGQIAFKIGLGILANEDLINTEPEHQKPMKFAEWIKENKGATMQDYIVYTGELLKHATVEVVEEPQNRVYDLSPILEEEENEPPILVDTDEGRVADMRPIEERVMEVINGQEETQEEEQENVAV